MRGQRTGLLAQLALVTAAHHQDLHVGEAVDQRRQGPQEHAHALARLVEAPEEQHRPAATRIAGQRRSRGERLDVDTVGDLDGVTAQRLHLPAPRQVGHRDAADDLLVHGPQDRLEHRQRQRLRRRRVKGGHDRAFGDVQRQHRQARGVRLVQMQHVEITLYQPSLHPAVGGRAEAQPSHRPVVGNRHRAPTGDHVVGQHALGGRRCEHADLVAEPGHHVGQLQHVRLHPARYVERVGTDHADPHQRALTRPRDHPRRLAPGPSGRARPPTGRGVPRTGPQATGAASCASRQGARRYWRRTGRPWPG